MIDPLSEFMSLLRPRTVFSKGISGAGRWAVRYRDFGQPSFCAVMEGRCRLSVDGHETIELAAGDFVLLPATPGFVLSGLDPATPILMDPQRTSSPGEEVRHGRKGGRPDVRLLGGYFVFDSPDAGLLVSLLPTLIHVRGEGRLPALVRMVREETRDQEAGHSLMLARLVEVLIIQALRAAPEAAAGPGLLRGLSDSRVATAIRLMHGDPARAWTAEQMARRASLSRSAFFDRFMRAVGVAPMEYLLAWRMAVAKDLLRRGVAGIEDVARQVGYGSASTFSTAFSRHVGMPPRRYARREAAAAMAEGD